MRLRDPRTLHLLALYVSPVVVAAARWGVGAAIGVAGVLAVAGCLIRLWLVTKAARRREMPPLRLHTATISHYSEKVRWCLDRLGVPYEERPNVGVLGVLLTGRSVPSLEMPPGLTRLGESSTILRYLYGEFAGRLPAERTWFLEPTPAALELEARFDRKLGNDVRIWVYEQVLRDRALTLRAWGVEDRDIPAWQRWLLVAFTPVLRFAVRRMLGVTPERARQAIARTHEAFADVEARLADGRRYLTGDTLTFADLTFASLGALAVLPPEYPGVRLRGRRISLEDVRDPQWRAEIERFRARPAGQWILRLYREERHPTHASRDGVAGG